MHLLGCEIRHVTAREVHLGGRMQFGTHPESLPKKIWPIDTPCVGFHLVYRVFVLIFVRDNYWTFVEKYYYYYYF